MITTADGKPTVEVNKKGENISYASPVVSYKDCESSNTSCD